MADYWIVDSIKNKLIEQDYEIGKELYRSKFQVEGTLSFISACYHLKTRGRFGVNVIQKKIGYSPNPTKSEILLKLNQKNLILIHDIYETPTYINIIRDLVDGLPLFEYFKSIGPYSEYNVGYNVKQILDGVRYLHEHKLIHGNLKSNNILVEKSGLVKIGDLTKSLIFNYDIYRLSIVALPSLCPPEVLVSQIYTTSIDLWSIGLITFILMYGYEPFHRSTETETYRSILKCDYKVCDDDVNLTSSLRHFIDNLLVVNPGDRMTVVDALRHPWLKVYHMKKNCQLYEVYPKFVECVSDIDDRVEESVMNQIRRAREIFENLVLQMPYKIYSK